MVRTLNPIWELGVGVYGGEGASHSWIWFLDLLDTLYPRLPRVEILNQDTAKRVDEKDLDILLVSGGDTFSLASSLGKEGSRAIEAFVRNGGTYWGACAGAYLVLRSSKPPLDLFNFVRAKIGNLSPKNPTVELLGERYKTQYGCAYVIHPIREEVLLSITMDDLSQNTPIPAPMYGGPVITDLQDGTILARFLSFTPRTKFLIDTQLASEMVIGKAALLRSRWGKGTFYVSGPHMEHPFYPKANSLVLRLLSLESGAPKGSMALRAGQGKPFKDKRLRMLKSTLSNIRIMARSMEFVDLTWKLGKKVYDPLKIIVYVEALWERLIRLEMLRIKPDPRAMEYLEMTCEIIRNLLKQILDKMELKEDTQEIAEKLFSTLREYSVEFFNFYYNTVRLNILENNNVRG